MAIRATEPIKKLRGKLRWGLRVSPAVNVQYCHPSYAHNTPIIATPKPEARCPVSCGGHRVEDEPANPRPDQKNTAAISRIAPTLIPVAQFVRSELFRVPQTLTPVTVAIIAIATSFASIPL